MNLRKTIISLLVRRNDPINKELARLKSIPRYQFTSTNLLGKRINVPDAASFLSSYYEIFEKKIYQFQSTKPSPTIIDCGANIGLGIIFWKHIFPDAKIIAFEPDPLIFTYLSQNCQEWSATNVKLINKAVWSEENILPFHQEGADAGRLENKTQLDNQVFVPSVRLRDYLTAEIDLLKIDVEGAEIEILRDCRDSLEKVENIFVEYHSFINTEQKIDELLRILADTGFRLHIQSGLTSKSPFVKRINYQGMDNSINIFGYRI